MVPTIIGWYVQWYLYVPAVLKVIDLLPEELIFPVSHTPLSLVDVCVVGSSFCHVTAVPLLTVSVAGLKL